MVRPRYRVTRMFTIQRKGRIEHDDISGKRTYSFFMVEQTNPIDGVVTRVNFRNRGTFDQLYGTGPIFRSDTGGWD
jgi:hypothetical protein